MKKILLFFFILLIGKASFATHNRAGEIVFNHLYGLTYEMTVVIFADPLSPAFDRKTIEISWGDNTGFDSLIVVSERNLTTNVSKRTWVGRHTFPGPGNYVISVTDLNRNAGINNIENSSQVPFYIETLLRISPFAGDENNSVILLNDPIDKACIGSVFTHNPGAYDPDGDSLAYELVKSKTYDGLPAPGYFFPPASNSITLDPVTGDLVWDEPTQAGQYNVSILIKEYRNGILLSSVLRDMQIDVINYCSNNPPKILTEDKHCVEAGTNLSFDVIANDPDAIDKVRLTATGGPFNFDNNPATFNTPPAANPITASFSWNSLCEHRRAALYNLSFKATDNADIRGETPLSTFKTVDIKVIAPAPKNFQAVPQQNTISLSWDNSFCPDANGYKLYRRRDSAKFVPDSCTMGVPAYTRYRMIAQLNGFDSTEFVDDNNGQGLVPGQNYCYLVVATFEDGDESYASFEVCAKVDQYTPVITQVSVTETDQSNGKIDLRWSPPDTIDVQQFPAPYQYNILMASGSGDLELLDSTASINDTIYEIVNINTLDEQHNFIIELYSIANGKNLVGRSTPANSVFLELTSSDQQLSLNWEDYAVPWNNSNYQIFRKDPDSTNFHLIAINNLPNYLDTGLIYKREYCYYIETTGDLQLENVPSPIINLSQQACNTPEDKTPPCPPEIELSSNCERGTVEIRWQLSTDKCASDVVSLLVYKSVSFYDTLKLISTITNLSNSAIFLDSTDFETLAGCYTVTSLDSNGNESAVADTICIDICPTYKLPNVITPNGDGHNDLFIPFPYMFVDSIDMTILNRWGQPVFKTKDPDINWDGTHYKENEKVSEGVYFYVCTVYEKTLYGNQPRILKGTVNVIDPQPSFPRK